jgi:DtxR family Mn-dependent transcriptional regulator
MPIHSESIQDYLKAVFELQQETERVSTSTLAEKLGVTPASVSGMIKKILKKHPDLLDYKAHRGVMLAPAGEKIALKVVRRHRLIELFLCNVLGYSWDEVHTEAEALEHVISDILENRIADLLGQPEFDPHGDPIPSQEGHVPPTHYVPLSELAIGQTAQIKRIRIEESRLLRYLSKLGLHLESTLTVIEKSPFDGPLHIQIGTHPETPKQAIGKWVADQVFVVVCP